MSTNHASNYPIGHLAMWRQDISMVGAFVAWAVVLGLLPVLVISALMAA